MAEGIPTGDMELAAAAPSDDDKHAQMRRRFEEIMAQQPTALIVLADISDVQPDTVRCVAIGSPVEIYVLHREGAKSLAAMMLRADEEASAERPASND